MRFDTVVFDLDGTLTESGEGIVNSTKYALENLGVPIPDQSVLESFVGPPLYDSFVNSCSLSDEKARQAVALYKQRHNVIGWKEARVYTGIFELIRSLKISGCFVALASSKPKDLCVKTLEYFGLLPFFDRVCAPDETNLRAPKSMFVRQALPEGSKSACMVGDRHFDIEGAIGAGVYPIGVLYGYGTRDELEKCGAKLICATVEELRSALLEGFPKLHGCFITFEGSDGCGKSTQHKLLREHLERCGIEVVSTREPGGCPISERIRDVLLDVKSMGMTDECEALLFAAARTQHIHDTILPALKAGKTVLCDRFVDSSIAYQAAGRGLGDWVKEINERAVSGCMPDLTLVFDLSPQEAIRRRYSASEADRIELSSAGFQNTVYDAFMKMCVSGEKRFYKVDASGSVEQIQQDVRHIVMEKLTSLPEADK